MSKYNIWKNRYKGNFNRKKKDENTTQYFDSLIPTYIVKEVSIKAPKLYCNHYNDDICLDSRILFPNIPQFIQCAFIDPGKVSCAIRIVRKYLYNGDIELLWFGIHNFGNGMEQIMIGVENELGQIKTKLQLCHHIVIESQFMKNEVNFRTFQHMISYIERNVRNSGMRPIIFEVSIELKTVFIGGPKTKSQYGGTEIKEWSKKKAIYELLKRGDYISLSTLKMSLDKQNEDLSDTVCYEFAWWFYLKCIKHLFLNVKWIYLLLN